MTGTKTQQLKRTIEAAWENREALKPREDTPERAAVIHLMNELDRGMLRVAEKTGPEKNNGGWVTHEWIKKGILLSFHVHESIRISGGPGGAVWYDKIQSKFQHWDEAMFNQAGFRAVPGATVRHSAYIAPGAVLMPCFVNVGAHVGENTMVDTWATVGSCAQIGRNVHISGGAGIGGVLEPLQANPVIIEDDCFIGARSEVAEGVIVEKGSVLAMGVFIGASSKIVDRATGKIYTGRVPAYSVVVPGALPPKTPGGPSLSCAVIVKQVDEKTLAKTSINDLLRD